MNRWMAVVRLGDGRLLIHNPVVDEAALRAIDGLGAAAFVVIPNRFHGRDALPFKHRYPQARVLCPAASAPSLRRQKKIIDGYLDELPVDSRVSLEPLDGIKTGESVLRVVDGDGRTTLVFGDALFNMAHGPGFMRRVLRLIGSTGGPRVTPLMRLAAVSDKPALAAHLRGLAQTPGLVRLVPGHGALIDTDAGATLAAVADRLSPGAR